VCSCHSYAGPKTLCNACGVKLVRKNRGTADAKRRAPTPASSAEKGHAAAAAHFLLDRDSLSPEPWSGVESGADEAPLPTSEAPLPTSADFAVPQHAFAHEPSPLGQTPAQLSRRPQRKAAAKAASRTAEFASTGDWPEDEGAPAAALSVRLPIVDFCSPARLSCPCVADTLPCHNDVCTQQKQWLCGHALRHTHTLHLRHHLSSLTSYSHFTYRTRLWRTRTAQRR